MRLQDLKRGMRCTRRDGKILLVDGVIYEDGTVLYYDNDKPNYTYLDYNLTSKLDKRERDIVIVEDITVDGFKVIWEREVEKYYLRAPNSCDINLSYLNYETRTGSYYFMGNTHNKNWETQFTLEEINKLPCQDFIKSLIKEKVE